LIFHAKRNAVAVAEVKFRKIAMQMLLAAAARRRNYAIR
jgi:hypothetical protein